MVRISNRRFFDDNKFSLFFYADYVVILGTHSIFLSTEKQVNSIAHTSLKNINDC